MDQSIILLNYCGPFTAIPPPPLIPVPVAGEPPGCCPGLIGLAEEKKYQQKELSPTSFSFKLIT